VFPQLSAAVQPIARITYTVLVETLNPAQSKAVQHKCSLSALFCITQQRLLWVQKSQNCRHQF